MVQAHLAAAAAEAPRGVDSSPSVDWRLRGGHDTAMYQWALNHDPPVVLVAGHTHRPVFGSSVPTPDVGKSVPELEATLGRLRSAGAEATAIAELRARIEWTRAEEHRVGLQAPTPLERPCYFNSGCCSYGDGDVTGLVLDGDRMRLVRWIRGEDDIAPLELEPASLTEVFRAVAGGAPGRG